MLDCSFWCQGWYNQLLDLEGDYFFTQGLAFFPTPLKKTNFKNCILYLVGLSLFVFV